jgi:hypothetical protein
LLFTVILVGMVVCTFIDAMNDCEDRFFAEGLQMKPATNDSCTMSRLILPDDHPAIDIKNEHTYRTATKDQQLPNAQ